MVILTSRSEKDQTATLILKAEITRNGRKVTRMVLSKVMHQARRRLSLSLDHSEAICRLSLQMKPWRPLDISPMLDGRNLMQMSPGVLVPQTRLFQHRVPWVKTDLGTEAEAALLTLRAIILPALFLRQPTTLVLIHIHTM